MIGGIEDRSYRLGRTGVTRKKYLICSNIWAIAFHLPGNGLVIDSATILFACTLQAFLPSLRSAPRLKGFPRILVEMAGNYTRGFRLTVFSQTLLRDRQSPENIVLKRSDASSRMEISSGKKEGKAGVS
jgi:hypothetical protein